MKTVTGARGHRHNMTKIKVTSKGTRSLLLKSAERTKGFLNLNMYVGGIDKLFKPNNRIITVILNFRQIFKNR